MPLDDSVQFVLTEGFDQDLAPALLESFQGIAAVFLIHDHNGTDPVVVAKDSGQLHTAHAPMLHINKGYGVAFVRIPHMGSPWSGHGQYRKTGIFHRIGDNTPDSRILVNNQNLVEVHSAGVFKSGHDPICPTAHSSGQLPLNFTLPGVPGTCFTICLLQDWRNTGNILFFKELMSHNVCNFFHMCIKTKSTDLTALCATLIPLLFACR